MKKYSFHGNVGIVICLAIALAVRLIFAVHQPRPIVTLDSPGYYELGRAMLKEPKLQTYINEFRTPLYPVFLAVSARATGFTNTNIYDPSFEPTGKFIADVQSVFGLIGVALLIMFARRMGFPSGYVMFFSILTSMNVLIFFWERSILTEGLATTMLLITLVCVARAMHAPKIMNLIMLCVSYAACFLLRPAFLFLPVATLPILYFALADQRERARVIWVFCISCIVPLVYIAGNFTYHNYRGIQRVGDIDILGRILEFHIPVEAGKVFPYVYGNVMDYRARNGNPMPFEFINTYDATMYVNTPRMNELQGFTYRVLLHNLPSYTAQALASIPVAMTDLSPFLKISGEEPGSAFFSVLVSWYRSVLPFTLLVFPLFPMALYLWHKRASPMRVMLVILGSVIITQILITVFVVYREDYGRLFAPLLPMFPLFIIGVLREVFLDSRRSRKEAGKRAW